MAENEAAATSEIPVDPDAQATAREYLDYTEHLPCEIMRSAQLMRKLKTQQQDSRIRLETLLKEFASLPASRVHAYGSPPTSTSPSANGSASGGVNGLSNGFAAHNGSREGNVAVDRGREMELRLQISRSIDSMLSKARESAAEASHLQKTVLGYRTRLDPIITELSKVRATIPSRDPTPAPAPSPAKPKPEANGNEEGSHMRITLRFDRSAGPASSSRRRRGTSLSQTPRSRLPPATPRLPGDDDSDGNLWDEPLADRTPFLAEKRKKKSPTKRTKISADPLMSGGAPSKDENGVPIPESNLPWNRLTNEELARLRKRMKKNSGWTPSVTMILRELETLGRGPINKHKFVDQWEGKDPSEIEIFGPEEGGIGDPDKLAANGAVDDAAGVRENKGMKLNRAKKRKREEERKEREREAERIAQEEKEKERERLRILEEQEELRKKELREQEEREQEEREQEEREKAEREAAEAEAKKAAEEEAKKAAEAAAIAAAKEMEEKERLAREANEAKEKEAQAKEAKVKEKAAAAAAAAKQQPEKLEKSEKSPKPLSSMSPPVTKSTRSNSTSTTKTLTSLDDNESISEDAILLPTAAPTRGRGRPPKNPATNTSPAAETNKRRRGNSTVPPTPIPEKRTKRSGSVAAQTPGQTQTTPAKRSRSATAEKGRSLKVGGRLTKATAGFRKKVASRKKADVNLSAGVNGGEDAEGPWVESVEEEEEEEEEDNNVYCICDEVSRGTMVKCDNDDCPKEWFHIECVKLTQEEVEREDLKWYCPYCEMANSDKRGGKRRRKA